MSKTKLIMHWFPERLVIALCRHVYCGLSLRLQYEAGTQDVSHKPFLA